MQSQLFGKDFITTEDWTKDELESALDLAGDLKRQWITGTYHDHLLALIKERVEKGEVTYQGRNLLDLDVTERARAELPAISATVALSSSVAAATCVIRGIWIFSKSGQSRIWILKWRETMWLASSVFATSTSSTMPKSEL